METLIITNNPRVEEEILHNRKKWRRVDRTELFREKDQMEILIMARNLIHLGAKLVMHPMTGRIRPHETPYKSVFLEVTSGELDMESLIMIEDSIWETQKFLNGGLPQKYDDRDLPDLRYVDWLLLEAGLEEYCR